MNTGNVCLYGDPLQIQDQVPDAAQLAVGVEEPLGNTRRERIGRENAQPYKARQGDDAGGQHGVADDLGVGEDHKWLADKKTRLYCTELQ